MKPTMTKADTDLFEYLNPDYHNFLKSYVKHFSSKTLSDKKPLTFKDFKRSKSSKSGMDIIKADDEDQGPNYQENLYYNYHTVEENNFNGNIFSKK